MLSEGITWDHAVMGLWARRPVSIRIFVEIDRLPQYHEVQPTVAVYRRRCPRA